MIVLDASAAVQLLLGLDGDERIVARLGDESETIHAPQLLVVEVAQVLRRFAARGEVDAGRGHDALTDLSSLGVELYDHPPLLDRVWQLRDHLTAYDGLYVALAEALAAPLLTMDAALAAAPGHTAVVELVVGGV